MVCALLACILNLRVTNRYGDPNLAQIPAPLTGRVREHDYHRSELERLAAEQETAMFIYLTSIYGDGPLKLGAVINCARTTGRPLIVDAAGSLGVWVKSAKG